jgi:PAS domain S-box-containing protein
MRRPRAFTWRISLGLGASLTVALIILTTAGLALQAVSVDDEQLTLHRARDLLEVERLHRSFSEKVASVRGFALHPEASLAQAAEQAREHFLASLQRIRAHALGAREQALMEQLASAEREHEAAVQQMLALAREGGPREQVGAFFWERVEPARLRVQEAIQRLVEHTERHLVEDTRRAESAEARALWLIPVVASLGLLGAAVLAWVLARALSPLLRQSEASERRFRLLVEGVKDHALSLLDPQGRVASWNPGAERITGWSAGEILGRSSASLLPEEAEGGLEQKLERAAREGQLQVEGWRVRKDGSRFWAESRLTALRDARGELEGYAVLTRDSTERKWVEDAQRLFAEAERLFHTSADPDQAVGELARLVVPQLADGCALNLLTPRGELQPRAVAHVSPEKERLLWELDRRYPPVPERPYGSWEVLRTGRSWRVAEVTPALVEERIADAELRALFHQLDVRSLLMVPLRVGERSLGVLVLLSHRPELRFTQRDQVFLEELAGRAALALENARLLREAQAALELIGVAAHDLSAPLHTLQLQLTRLRRAPPEEPGPSREGLAAALRQTQRMGRLLHNLLDLSRLSSGHLELELEEVDLGELVRDTVERHAEQAEEAGSPLALEGGGGVVGRWDRLRLERVLTNLLSNALKYGQGQPISVEARRAGDLARLVVRDHGPGIPPEQQRAVFERFRKGSSAGGKKEGFGLGLYIVRQLVEAHGGAVRVESTPGQGATFTVELPLRLAFQEMDAGPSLSEKLR